MVKIKRAEPSASAATEQRIVDMLDQAYQEALSRLTNGPPVSWNLSKRLHDSLESLSNKAAPPGSTGFTNVVTCLAIKSALPEIDIRNHQVQIGAPFGFRTVSETIIYPWLDKHGFQGAKSGWQTRTFERNSPYTMDYPHKITSSIRIPFLTCFDEVEERGADAFEGLTFLIFKQLELRQRKRNARIRSAANDYSSYGDIAKIVSMFERHFALAVVGTARLPVLAVYAIYLVMMDELSRYEGKTLLELQRHSAADTRTGALGDIEIAREDETIFEALEIKHQQPITSTMIRACARKVEGSGQPVDRYYILTTHAACRPTQEMQKQLNEIAKETGTQIVVNGVLPTIQYYLRLLKDPSRVLPAYWDLLNDEKAISPEHLLVWKKMVDSAGDFSNN